MRKRLQNFLHRLEMIDVTSLNEATRERIIRDLLIQIKFFQHERLVHLIILVAVAVLLFLSILLIMIWHDIIALVLSLFLLVLFVPYLFHYYFLENGVQRLYQFYDIISIDQELTRSENE